MTHPHPAHPPARTPPPSSEWYGLDGEPPPPAAAAPPPPPSTAGRGPGLATRLRRTPRRVVAAFVAALLAVVVFLGGFTVGRTTAPEGHFNPHHAPSSGQRR